MDIVATGLGIIQTGFVAGIFWRMGGFQATMQNLISRVERLEKTERKILNELS